MTRQRLPEDKPRPNATTKSRARRLRRDQTDVEQRLWHALRDRRLDGAKFRRQAPIGPYIVDFVCPARRLIVELDGGQHASESSRDAQRTHFLESHGYRVVRFWNNEAIENFDGVLATIHSALEA
jgi:very-short-patch-repair endonuclease